MCKDPQHGAFKYGKWVGYLILAAAWFMSFCPKCWSSRLRLVTR